MKYFYTLLLARPPEKQLLSDGALPDRCPKLHSAQNTILYTLKNGLLVQQQLYHAPHYLELLWLETARPVTVNYHLPESATFLFYVLQGQLKIQAAEDGKPFLQVSEGHHHLVQDPPGNYTAFYPKGRHLCFFIMIPDSWMSQHREAFPYLANLISWLKSDLLARYQVPKIFMNQDLYRWFDKQSRLQPANPVILEGLLLQALAYLLQGYENALSRQHALAFDALKHILEQYTSQDFSHGQLAVQLYISTKTLSKRFEAAFGCSPSAFATRLRMKHAHRLLTQENLPVKDVYFAVGYKNRHTFWYAYDKFLKAQKS